MIEISKPDAVRNECTPVGVLPKQTTYFHDCYCSWVTLAKEICTRILYQNLVPIHVTKIVPFDWSAQSRSFCVRTGMEWSCSLFGVNFLYMFMIQASWASATMIMEANVLFIVRNATVVLNGFGHIGTNCVKRLTSVRKSSIPPKIVSRGLLSENRIQSKTLILTIYGFSIFGKYPWK